MRENLEKLLNTLNLIEVRGAENLNRLLGSIQFLQGVIHDLGTREAVPENEINLGGENNERE